MSSCECNNWGMVVALSILTSTMAVLLASSGSGSSLGLGIAINNGMNYLASGELYYIDHPLELFTAPWFWFVTCLILAWKAHDIF